MIAPGTMVLLTEDLFDAEAWGLTQQPVGVVTGHKYGFNTVRPIISTGEDPHGLGRHPWAARDHELEVIP